MFLTLQGFTLYQLFFYFIIYSVMGWIMETILCSYNEKKFVNRGYLSGPYCPIYGVGMCLIILTLSSYQDRLTDLFLGGILQNGGITATKNLIFMAGFVCKFP